MRFAVGVAGRALAWSLGFLSRDGGTTGGMAIPPARRAPDEASFREVVPARAVLTELARGFLLVREVDRERAVRFAATFLREHAEPTTRPAPAPYPAAPPSQRSLGRPSAGAVERPDPRPPR